MSSFTLVINSSNVTNTNNNSIYTYNFINGGFRIEDDMEVMVSSDQIPYSIFNITAAYNNNSFVLYFPTGSTSSSYTQFTITLPDGFYTMSDFNNYIDRFCITNGLYLINSSGQNVYYIGFSTNQNYYSVQLSLYTVPTSLPTGYTAPSNWIGYSTYSSARTPYIVISNSLTDYLGFTQGQYPATLPQTSNYSLLSNKKPPMATYVNSIIIHSSLVNNNVVSPSDIIDAFQISNTTFGADINYTPAVEKYVKLTKGVYNSMIIYLTDQNNNPIILNDPNILITLLFKKKSKL